ncbi:MAG: class I SAM-dependent methyltransferase, partial [Pseudomonadales bacterium]
LLYILRVNFATYSVDRWLQPIIKLLLQWNKVSRSYRNVAHHYDLGDEFFRLFLDENMHYSCAYFLSADDTLEQAQTAKCRHISQKLLLQPGQRVLDIGCGWGSLTCYLAQTFDVEVVGISLSNSQLAAAKQRAQALGLSNVRFELQDYRQHSGLYDRIVSVGMFEHVGAPFHRAYFQNIMKLLVEDGAALVHSIGRSGPPGVVNPWIIKHIFPGGHIPSLSEMARGAENARLMLTDIEVLRLHYAKTLRAWFDRFQSERDEISKQMGEEFCRMWEFYLAIGEVSFECSDLVVFQLQLARQHNVVPITRDYLYSTAVNHPELCDLELPN